MLSHHNQAERNACVAIQARQAYLEQQQQQQHLSASTNNQSNLKLGFMHLSSYQTLLT